MAFPPTRFTTGSTAWSGCSIPSCTASRVVGQRGSTTTSSRRVAATRGTERGRLMKTLLHAAALFSIAALAGVPAGALAQPSPAPEDRHEIALDIDNDGKMDRAVLVRHPKSRDGDLFIYLDAGTG